MDASARLAVLRPAEVNEAQAAAWLSDRERAGLAALRAARRRHEWIAARLAAKYLFLGAPQAQPSPVRPWRPRITWLTWAALDAFPAWAYRRVDIAPSGVPRLTWRGRVQPVHVSLAHGGGLAAACLDWRAAIGIDIERIEPRTVVFRKAHFSDAERAWAEAACRDATGVDRAYTLLWSVKESALKAQERDSASVWQLPGLELSVGDGAWNGALDASPRARPFVMPATVRWSQSRDTVDVFVAGNGDLLFTGVRLQEKVA